MSESGKPATSSTKGQWIPKFLKLPPRCRHEHSVRSLSASRPSFFFSYLVPIFVNLENSSDIAKRGLTLHLIVRARTTRQTPWVPATVRQHALFCPSSPGLALDELSTHRKVKKTASFCPAVSWPGLELGLP